jgi:chromosome segregation ATPase
MGAAETERLEAEEANLAKTAEKARAELKRLTERRDTLKQDIEKLKRSVGRLESAGPRVVALTEYKRLRAEVLQAYKDLARAELGIMDTHKNLELACRDLKSTQERLRQLRRPRPT